MISVVCWLWPTVRNYRSSFGPKQVNIFRNMIERNLHMEHEVVCITNIPKGIDPRVRIIPLWTDYSDVASPHGGVSPSCYRRLKAFSPEMADIIGPRFISMDLDVCIISDITPLLQRTEDFIIWGSVLRTTPYNGSMWMMDAGARKEVWDDFDPIISPKQTRKAGYHGSDQAWLSYKLGKGEPQWTPESDGVYAFRSDIKKKKYHLPEDARIIFFQGHNDPWDSHSNKIAPWIKDYYF
ncbi:MAG: hypothetical protein KAJ55_09035 [Anaerolineales bacterium]|nr:hypothetical protein [Anaerolineales bacterium]